MRSRSAKTRAAVNVWIDRPQSGRRIVWPVVPGERRRRAAPPCIRSHWSLACCASGWSVFSLWSFLGALVRFSVILGGEFVCGNVVLASESFDTIVIGSGFGRDGRVLRL
ncbi:MAG: hypothetical protein IPF98_18850 [Gemmatimonadetes bacterium]|nr:hypothetical protein [Gemmatimonadota bacterium]